MFKKITISILIFFLPSFLLSLVLKTFGYKTGKKLKIGFSILLVDEMEFSDNVKIGHLSFIYIKYLSLGKESRIGSFNILKGNFNCILKEKSIINKNNHFTRGNKGVISGKANIILGINSIITVKHHLDLTRSITFGNHSILAGIRSQMWTHGYYHAETGPDRCRIDGEIKIGDNVYIGSGCIFNPGVSVGNAIHIGAGAVISKNLEQPGMYVGQALRYIATNFETVKSKLHKVEDYELIEEVYEK